MSLKTILTMLALGTSSVALAQPTVRDHRDLDTSSITISGGVHASVGFSTSPPRYDGARHDDRFDRHDRQDRQDRQDDRFDRHDRHDRSDNRRFDRRDRGRWNRGRWDRDRDADRFSREVMLAPAATMSLTRDGNAFHAIDTRLRVMSLQLEGFGGTQYVSSIVLHLANGSHRSVSVRRWLDMRNRQLTINLGSYGTSLRAISVYGSSPFRTSLQITGVVR